MISLSWREWKEVINFFPLIFVWGIAKRHTFRKGSADLTGNELRKIILAQSYRAGVGHIGSALSVADMIAVLYGKHLYLPDREDPARDRFLLSKGHAALALYAALYRKGILSSDELNTFCGDDTLLGVHPEHGLPGVECSTGSLGQGLSIATGMALGLRHQKIPGRIFVLISDAECNEGSLWEAMMFAAHHRLSHLTVLVDKNEQQAFGYTRDVISLDPLSDRWKAMGWDVWEINGHDEEEIADRLQGLDYDGGPPHVLIAHTLFGKGVSFMEGQIRWHYWPMNEEQYRQAMLEVESAS